MTDLTVDEALMLYIVGLHCRGVSARSCATAASVLRSCFNGHLALPPQAAVYAASRKPAMRSGSGPSKHRFSVIEISQLRHRGRAAAELSLGATLNKYEDAGRSPMICVVSAPPGMGIAGNRSRRAARRACRQQAQGLSVEGPVPNVPH